MRREGINLLAGELGLFLNSRLGSDALRVQLLDTALQGKEDYDDVEREVLRLFRELHVADPLNKAKPSGGESHSYPLQPFLQSSNQPGLRSGAPSSAGSSVKSFKTSSSYRFGSPSSSASSGRQAYVEMGIPVAKALKKFKSSRKAATLTLPFWKSWRPEWNKLPNPL